MTTLKRRPVSPGIRVCRPLRNPLAPRRWIRQAARMVGCHATYAAVVLCLMPFDRDATGYTRSNTGTLPGKHLPEEAKPHFACSKPMAEIGTPFLDSDLFVSGKSHGAITRIPGSVSLLKAQYLQMHQTYHNHVQMSTCLCQRRVRFSPWAAGSVTTRLPGWQFRRRR